MAPYRDPLAGLREQTAELQSLAADREQELPAHLRAELPAALREQLEQARPKKLSGIDRRSASELHGHLAALRGYLTSLDRALDELPAICDALTALPPTVDDPPGRLSPVVPVPADSSATFDGIESSLRRLDAHAQAIRWARRLCVRFGHQGVPYALLYEPRDVWTGAFSLATSVARAAPRLSLRPELTRHVLLKPLGLVRDATVGSAAFDGQFLVAASGPAARSLLTEATRRGLLRLCSFDIPTLDIDEGRAMLCWNYAAEPRAIRAAIDALAALRSASAQIDPRQQLTR